MLARLRNNYQLALITLFGASSALLILPFAVYRFATGATRAGILDTLLVAGMLSVVGYAWRTGNVLGPGRILAAINTTGAVASASLLGDVGLFWMYAVQITNYFLIPLRAAAVVSLAALAILVVRGKAFDSTAELMSFLVSSLLVSLLSYILSSRTHDQRRQLEALASQDPLTGIFNRRALQSELEIAVAGRKRGGAATGLVLFDIDRFKRVNDECGHETGDHVLVNLARQTAAGLRGVDRLFRYGGEEFVVLLPGTDVAGLAIAAEHLRDRIERDVASPIGPVTVSVGCAALAMDETSAAWLARADAALYRAKQSGRNCVEMA